MKSYYDFTSNKLKDHYHLTQFQLDMSKQTLIYQHLKRINLLKLAHDFILLVSHSITAETIKKLSNTKVADTLIPH